MTRAWVLAALLFGLAALAEAAPVDAVAQAASAARSSEPEASPRRPPGSEADWRSVTLPTVIQPPAGDAPHPTWVWFAFEHPAASTEPWAVCLPYLYGGGQLWLNGQQVGSVPEALGRMRGNWERPHMLPLPDNVLRDGRNELMLRVVPAFGSTTLKVSKLNIGPLSAVRERYDRRFFWARTMPQITAAACLVAALFVAWIWWRRRSEQLYGLFALAAALWGIRTLTFVIEVMPADQWVLWRIVYLASTGGFVVVMAIFASRVAGLRHPRVEQALLVYWLVGPAWLAWQGEQGQEFINRVWSTGLLAIGIGIVAVSFWAVWQQRTWLSAILPAALSIATLAGVHDYLIVWRPDVVEAVLPGWAGERLLLLHHGANLSLMAMGALLTLRFTHTLGALQQLNESLELRIAEREHNLADNYVRLAALERQNAAASERQLIMREIHDGLGSKLFTTLSRVERGALNDVQMADSLRACIADMRLALDALAPEDHDLRTAFGDFMFRWKAELDALGVRSSWTIEMPGDAPGVPPHTTVQLLRIAQEALTNVTKHARAARVDLVLAQAPGQLRLVVQDDGIGTASGPGAGGRGTLNMHSRADQIGGSLQVVRDERGTCVTLIAPLKLAAPALQIECPVDECPTGAQGNVQ